MFNEGSEIQKQMGAMQAYDPNKTMLASLDDAIAQTQDSLSKLLSVRKKLVDNLPLASFTRDDMNILRRL